MKVEYPIVPAYGSNPSEIEKEKTNAYHFGHNNRNGFFPLGINNSWHGGIHIEGLGTQVRAIADGRIIAYRFAEDYLLEKDSETAKYSNSFMLMQHDFETLEKIKFRFYSLYMHLQPKEELIAKKYGENIPDLYAKNMVKANIKSHEIGLKIRRYCKEDTEQSAETQFVSKGGLLKKEPSVTLLDTHWTNADDFKNKYVICSYKGDKFCAYRGWLLDYNDEFYQVNHKQATDDDFFRPYAVEGTMLFDGIGGNYVKMESQNTELEIEFTKDADWYKIKGTRNYVLAADCTPITKKIKDDVKFNSVENVNVPIKAGQIIGNLGQYDSENRKSYNALHLEVFTDDANLSGFLNNNKDKDQTTYEVEKGKTLHVGKPCDFLKAKTKVKIYQSDGDYTQIGFEDETAVVPRDTLDYGGKRSIYVKGSKTNKSVYTIKEAHFDEINIKLKGLLEDEKSEVYFINETGDEKLDRTIGYGTKYSGKKFWVKSTKVTGDPGAWVSLVADIDTVFENKPSDNSKGVEVLKTSKIRKTTEAKDHAGETWWHIKTKQEEGWIKKSELTEKNPYKWEEFGWKVLENTGDQYFYMFGEFVEKSSPHKFVEDIWEQADTDGDSKLSNFELQQVMRNKESLDHVSKLICKHESEWNTWENIDKFESELKEIYKKGIEGKQELVAQRDAKISVLKDKIKNLSFWHEIEEGDLSNTKAEDCGKRKFPRESNVYHFHPIAFVEQMKMIVGGQNVINIYWDGTISKLENEKLEAGTEIKIVYHDVNGETHILGKSKAIITRRHTKKNTISTISKDDILMVYVKDFPSYSKGNVKFKFAVWNSNSNRWYINPYCLAGLLGAMIEESIEDLSFNGFSVKNGNTAGGSSSHINGKVGDLRYLSINKNGERTLLQDSHFDYDRQVKFNNALYKFGWGVNGENYSENFSHNGESTLLPHTKHMKKTTGNAKYRHHHHIHLKGFDFSRIK
ncbi:hypothetical protein Q4566_10700 [Tamlana sp. 2_MG-2023]|uniref:hypothetical protein n=1 Tax=unclassified Tamlana TaxID=2614803 RepID=UPI0026E123D6|nr:MULTISPECIES: hypothetical protein [unclassified Tamlana]MDO6760669.1 hypothetical protein [Tamlana sp. 2_MG-2023]MDO6790925.1 hypothetical protein [Tamlana sp. 1_MG-2023]